MALSYEEDDTPRRRSGPAFCDCCFDIDMDIISESVDWCYSISKTYNVALTVGGCMPGNKHTR